MQIKWFKLRSGRCWLSNCILSSSPGCSLHLLRMLHQPLCFAFDPILQSFSLLWSFVLCQLSVSSDLGMDLFLPAGFVLLWCEVMLSSWLISHILWLAVSECAPPELIEKTNCKAVLANLFLFFFQERSSKQCCRDQGWVLSWQKGRVKLNGLWTIAIWFLFYFRDRDNVGQIIGTDGHTSARTEEQG